MASKHPRIYPRTLSNGESRYDVVVDHTDPDSGKRKQQMKTFRTKAEAQAWLAERHVAEASGMGVARNKQTVASLLREWLELHAPNVKPTTLDQYRRTVERHVIPQLGGVQVQHLTARHLQHHYAALGKAGVGARTVRFVHERMVQALDQARRLGIVARNVAEDATPPRMPRHEMKAWDDEEIDDFLDVAERSIYGPLWTLALYTGLRRGELLGLRWQDVDWDGRVLMVKQSITVLQGRPVTQSTKSGRQRKVSVPQDVLDLLREHRLRQMQQRLKAGAAWQDSHLVFTVAHGGPVHPDNVDVDFRRLCRLAGVPAIRIHDLRHSHASLLLRHGEQLKVVSERLGHARTSITMDTYAHVVPDQHRETAERLGRLLARRTAT